MNTDRENSDRENSRTGKVAFVTGAGSGFGLLTVVRLIKREDVRTVYACIRKPGRETELLKTASEKGFGEKVRAVFADVTDGAAISECERRIRSEAGRLDILVNNAGYGLGGFFEDISDEEFRAQFETNFFGVLQVCRVFLPLMRETSQKFQTRTRLVQISSISGKVAFPAVGAYCSSKFALEGFSEALRMELSPFGVDVVLVEPGSYQTKIFTENLRIAKGSLNCGSPYFERTQRVTRAVEKQPRNPNPDEVAAKIEQVIFVRKPRLRYLVGRDAVLMHYLKLWLPFSWIEKISLRM